MLAILPNQTGLLRPSPLSLPDSKLFTPPQTGLIGQSLPKSKRSTIIIQNRPNIESIPESRPILPPGPVLSQQNISSTYNPDQLIVVGPPNRSSIANNDAQTLSVINTVPLLADVPTFVYLRDPETRQIVRYLAQDERDNVYYDTSPNYGISQQWLLSNRQGDEYDRLPERHEFPEYADAERDNLAGVTTLNRGRVWYGSAPSRTLPESSEYIEYERFLEYARTQEQEEDKS